MTDQKTSGSPPPGAPAPQAAQPRAAAPAPMAIPELQPVDAAPVVAGTPVAAPQGAPAPAATPAPSAVPRPSVLDDVPILRPLSPLLKSQLEAQLARKVLQPGEILFTEGDMGDAMYIIASGLVSVFVTDKALGLTVDLATLGKGEAFGEMALVTGEKRSASVKAVERTEVLGLSRDVFYRLVQAVPQVGLTIASTLAKRLEQVNRTQGVHFGSLRGVKFEGPLKELLPPPLIHRHKMVPVSQSGGIVTIATPDPNNQLAIDDVRRVLRGLDVKLMAVSEADFDSFVAQHVPKTQAPQGTAQQGQKSYAAAAQQLRFFGAASESGDEARLRQSATSPDVVQLLNLIVAEGIERGASDIHIEPDRELLRVRYRIDGRLMYREGEIPMAAHQPLISRMKVLASLDIAERRLPQDGRISLAIANKQYDLRLATVVTKYGEKVTLRVLDSSTLQADLGSLILGEKISQVVRKLFYRPNGLVLVTGPTGSGKTTTLYAALLERRNPELSICTIEDPIEYNVDDITQVQVNEGVGLGFPEIMRTYLRQDPDVILVGETRDAETARLACNAALTGHLVLSSFHTNDAISAVLRLKAMGIEPFVLSDALLGVINQRLVRRICPACRVETKVGDLIVRNLQRAGVALDPNVKFYKGQGCNLCHGDGFKGRIGVYELLLVGPGVRDAIARDASATELRQVALDGSYVPLVKYASYLLNEGLTVPSEVLRILPRE